MALSSRILLTALVAACVVAAQATPAGAAEGDLVRSFSGDGRVVTDLDHGSRDQLTAAQFDSGDLLAAGGSVKSPYGVRMALVRYLPSGELDPAFGDGGIVLSDADGGFFPAAMTIDGYGAIVIAGFHHGGAPHSGGLAVARLLEDGRPDPEFADGDGVVSLPIPMQVGGVKPGLNGRIDVAGTLRESGGVDLVVVQLLRNGSLDPAFGDGGVVRIDLASGGNDRVTDLIVDPLDRLVVVGGAWPRERGGERPIGRFAMVRLLPDGSLDRSLNGSGKVLVGMGRQGGFATAVMVDRRGPVILAGMSATRLAFAAVREGGRLYPPFGHGGRAFVDVRDGYRVGDVSSERNGRILAALGDPEPTPRTGNMVALRLLDNGHPDRSFGRDGRVSTGFGSLLAWAGVVVQNHVGQFALAGTAKAPQEDPDFAVAEYYGGG